MGKGLEFSGVVGNWGGAGGRGPFSWATVFMIEKRCSWGGKRPWATPFVSGTVDAEMQHHTDISIKIGIGRDLVDEAEVGRRPSSCIKRPTSRIIAKYQSVAYFAAEPESGRAISTTGCNGKPKKGRQRAARAGDGTISGGAGGPGPRPVASQCRHARRYLSAPR